ncbi:class I SAM-dependent methyltransferase [Haloarchaeobius salinus]|uniref:class I SAM-dependent methyltransferase n=1 Tax=Haloarchaeobius salinus TaxID=1198298 RepID=UPI00210B389B|nr:class I SAM-dependent methyltransferase [Haloarchaeobius salinus]
MSFDWERDFYAATDWDRGAYLGGEAMPGHLETFFERVGVPESVADVGCGPALVPFELAPGHPDTEFHCYDVAPSVVEANRERAADEDLDNLHFSVAGLPYLGVDRQFDLVYCMATLYFVADAERAVTELYGMVAPGGTLVCNYPNRYTKAWVNEDTEDQRREAFELVGRGENLLSYERIGELLDRTPLSYWSAVGASDADYARRSSPAVYVHKPA